MNARRRLLVLQLALAASTVGLSAARSARADLPVRIHAGTGLAHDALAPQSRETSWGAAGALDVEVPLGRVIGAQAELGALGLSDGSPPEQRGLADKGATSALTAMGGLRAQAFDGHGPWADLNGGVAHTGALERFAFDAHVGYDVAVGRSGTALGPVLGYVQVVQPDDQVRPDDAHVVWLGLHVAFGARGKAPVAAPPPPPAEKPAPVLVKAPPPVIVAAASDRDGDGIVDGEDACPDVRGVKSDDPHANGCPPPEGPVRLEGDRIEIDDVILFAFDDPRVHHASHGLVKKIADFIEQNPDIEAIDIDGHADEIGTEEHNMRLSAARAESVRRLLVEYGVDPNRLSTHAFGESRPRDAGHSEQAHQKNRRVEFIVVHAHGGGGGPVAQRQDEGRDTQQQQQQDEQEKGR